MYIMQNNKCSHLFQICDKQFYWVFPLTFQRTCDILSCVNVFVLYINTKREGPFSQYPTDIPRMKAALVLSVFIAQAFGQTAECNPPLPSECGETDIRWDSSNLLFLPHLLNQVVTWEHMRTVGWETSVCPRVPSVLPPAPAPPPLSAWTERWCATWEHLPRAAGWETTAWQRDPSVPLCATLRPRLSARRKRSSATPGSMRMVAGWETTACQWVQTVLLLNINFYQKILI